MSYPVIVTELTLGPVDDLADTEVHRHAAEHLGFLPAELLSRRDQVDPLADVDLHGYVEVRGDEMRRRLSRRPFQPRPPLHEEAKGPGLRTLEGDVAWAWGHGRRGQTRFPDVGGRPGFCFFPRTDSEKTRNLVRLGRHVVEGGEIAAIARASGLSRPTISRILGEDCNASSGFSDGEPVGRQCSSRNGSLVTSGLADRPPLEGQRPGGVRYGLCLGKHNYATLWAVTLRSAVIHDLRDIRVPCPMSVPE